MTAPVPVTSLYQLTTIPYSLTVVVVHGWLTIPPQCRLTLEPALADKQVLAYCLTAGVNVAVIKYGELLGYSDDSRSQC